MDKLQILEKIVSEHQSMKVQSGSKKIMLDVATACAILTVYNACNAINREKLLALDWPKMASVTWKLLK